MLDLYLVFTICDDSSYHLETFTNFKDAVFFFDQESCKDHESCYFINVKNIIEDIYPTSEDKEI